MKVHQMVLEWELTFEESGSRCYVPAQPKKKKKSIFSSIFSIWSESWTLSGSKSKSSTPNYIPNKKHPESIGNVDLSSTTQ